MQKHLKCKWPARFQRGITSDKMTGLRPQNICLLSVSARGVLRLEVMSLETHLIPAHMHKFRGKAISWLPKVTHWR